ncbi:hypothetical protein [Microbacterium sp. cx-59]|uniref:hypothetical protein n=1 Tax=Microbacterium sp. cx-59 TaxID=2891207 RepID=UPI001E34EB43|nr:hypothetical protein [Microbacterium sp. cx-59]MCC4907784.1 hypothetical protein [Microbacterium sp. cx-59]
MTKNPPTRRHYARRSRRVRVTTQTDGHSAVTLAQILTSAALQKALLEAEAEADHATRASKRTQPAGMKQGVHRA